MSTTTRPADEYQAKDYKSDLKPIWCPGCGDFGVVQAIYRALVERRAPASRDRLRLGHRLLEPHPGLHHGLRLQQRPRPGAADRAGHQARQPRPPRPRGRGRRRRLLDRRRPRGPRRPPQHGPHLHRDGQPDLRPHQGPALADLAAGPARPRPRPGAASRTRSTRCSTCSAYGASFVAQGTPADMQGLAAVIEEAIRFPGFAFVNVQSPCVTYGQEEQQLKAQKGIDADARQPRPRPGRPPEGHGARLRVRAQALHRRLLPQPGAAARPTRRRPGAGRRRRGPRPARRSASSRCSGRSSRGAPP